MKFINIPQANGGDVKIHYQDVGKGKPVVLIHGWPLDHQMWEYQLHHLSTNGYRCIAYDRRGFGHSDKPADGYDYSTLVDDLKALLEALDLRDVALVGFSMAGGEVVRYFSRHGGERVSKAVLISSIAPFMMQTSDNPDGVPKEKLEAIAASLEKDRATFLTDFGKQFYGVDLLSHPVCKDRLRWNHHLAMQASLTATLECAKSFGETDLRSEMSSIQAPLLIIHGDSDLTVPIEATSAQAAKMVPHAVYKTYGGAPHGLFFTEKDKLNQDLTEFLSL